jgi:hypothetical protein
MKTFKVTSLVPLLRTFKSVLVMESTKKNRRSTPQSRDSAIERERARAREGVGNAKEERGFANTFLNLRTRS